MASLKSWWEIPSDSHFSLANIPFGIVSTSHNDKPRVATAIGDHALDLEAFAAENGFSSLSTVQPHQSVFSQPTLNAFAALGRPIHSAVRKYIQSVFSQDTPFPGVLKSRKDVQEKVLIPLKEVKNRMPFAIGDYTDFFVGLNHAENCARIMGVKVQPNYRHLPVGYHGRASSVVVSGTDIRRPSGQIVVEPGKPPIFSACRRLDFELELGCFICKPNAMGEPVSVDSAQEHLFGVVLMNDWSARDIQAWEMAPLGPFNSKNFGTSISAWVVTTEALEPFLAEGIKNNVELLPYLQEKRKENIYDIKLSVELQTSTSKPKTIVQTRGTNLLFSFSQMLAHHTVGGCPFNVGDLMASGTVSGTQSRISGDDGCSSYGALIEINEAGSLSIKLANGEERRFLEDGDTVTFAGVCGKEPGALVGFGTCSGTILPAVQF